MTIPEYSLPVSGGSTTKEAHDAAMNVVVTSIRDSITAAEVAIGSVETFLAAALSDIDELASAIGTLTDHTPSEWATGYYAHSGTGVVTAAASYSTSLVVLPPGQAGRFSASFYGGPSVTAVLVFYSDDGGTAYLSSMFAGPGPAPGDAVTYADQDFTVPTGARSVRITVNAGGEGEVELLLQEVEPGVIAAQADQISGILEAAQGYRPEPVAVVDDTYYRYSDGAAIGGFATYTSLAPVAVTPGETVKLTAFGSGGATAKVVWLTPEGAFHSYEDRHLGVDVNYSREDIVVPEGVGFGLFTSNTTTPPVVERIGFAPITYDEAVALAAPAILLGPALNFWQDKKIVHFGTSIPEGSGANSYPPKYGAILGATVVNQAKASSMIALGVGAAATATDPYGWTGTKYIHARKSLARSNAEAQDMIDNWGDWKTLLQGAPSSLDETAEGVILGTTYEALLDPHLGDTDLFVFDHGYNDVAALKTNSAVSLDGSQVLQVPGVDVLVDGAGDSVDRLDRRWFLGANEFLFNRILEADPRARIAIVGHYEDQRTPLASQAQEALHARWRFPLVRLWERTGWSEQEVDVGGVMTPMINVWCPDGTHPHSDAAGRSTDLLATIIAEQIRQIR